MRGARFGCDYCGSRQMSNKTTVRIPTGRIVRYELKKARKSGSQPFLLLAGMVDGPANLSTRKGFSRK